MVETAEIEEKEKPWKEKAKMAGIVISIFIAVLSLFGIFIAVISNQEAPVKVYTIQVTMEKNTTDLTLSKDINGTIRFVGTPPINQDFIYGQYAGNFSANQTRTLKISAIDNRKYVGEKPNTFNQTIIIVILIIIVVALVLFIFFYKKGQEEDIRKLPTKEQVFEEVKRQLMTEPALTGQLLTETRNIILEDMAKFRLLYHTKGKSKGKPIYWKVWFNRVGRYKQDEYYALFDAYTLQHLETLPAPIGPPTEQQAMRLDRRIRRKRKSDSSTQR